MFVLRKQPNRTQFYFTTFIILPTYIVYFTEGCENISDIEFVGCHTINNEALNRLQILKNCLTSLKINSCINISDEGIIGLEHLQ